MGAKVRDHRYTMTKLNAQVPDTTKINRNVWNYSRADWAGMKEQLKERDWEDMRSMSADEAAETLTETILNLAESYIGKKSLQEIKSSHPWLTDEIIQLTEQRRKAEGTPIERELMVACSEKTREE